MGISTGIKARLTISFIIAAAVPLIAIGVLAIAFITDDLEDEITSRNQQLAQSVAGEIGMFLDEPLHILTEFANAINTGYLADSALLASYFNSHLKHHEVFKSFMVLDPDGYVRHIAPANSDLIGVDMSSQVFYRETMASKVPLWTRAVVSMQTGLPVTTLSIPSGRGMVVGELDLQKLKNIIDRVTLGSEGYAVIVDEYGTIIAHPNWDFVLEQVNVKNLDIIRRALEGKEGSSLYRFMDVEKLGSVALVPHTDWIVLVTQPVKEAFANVRYYRKLVIAGVLAAITLALLISYLTLERLVRPIVLLTESARQVAEGDYGINLSHGEAGYREVKELSSSFERMVEAVHSREEFIQSSLKEKEILLAEIHHRVKNNMAIISALLNLQANEINIPEAAEGFQYSINRIRSMALVHEMLYRHESFSRINLKEYIGSLLNNVIRFGNIGSVPFKVRLDIEDMPLDLDRLIPCGLIINEIASNSLKHAFSEVAEPEVWVSVRKTESGRFEIGIGDNGKGMSEDFDADSEGTLGMRIIRILVEQLEGDLEVIPSRTGTAFRISFPFEPQDVG
jgi:two-component sensor histidine kinase